MALSSGDQRFDKIGVIENLLDKVNVMAIGGGMLFTFLAAQGHEIGKSLVEVDLIPTVKELMVRAETHVKTRTSNRCCRCAGIFC
jgi:phosphoglycerate kinase